MPELPAPSARWGVAFLYLCALGWVAAVLPLRLPEVLQLSGFREHNWGTLMKWVAFTPGAAPLNYLCQWPFIAVAHTPLLVRAVSLFCGAASLLVFWRIAEQIRIRQAALVAALFGVFPITFALAITARPAAQGLLMALIAAWCFLETAQKPSIGRVCLYGAVLTAAIYTTPFAFAPALGYLLFSFRFVAHPQQRRTIWMLLPATFIPLLAYLPFYAWAVRYAGDGWLYETDLPHTAAGQFYQAVTALGPGTLAGLAILIVGALVGAWTSFLPLFPARWSEPLLERNIAVFCLFGGAVSVFAATIALSLANVAAIDMEGIASALPLLLLAFAAGVEYFRVGQKKWTLLPVLAGVLIAGSVAQDFRLAEERRSPNLQTFADAVVPELAGDSCVVFVSERLSPRLFLTLRPELRRSECLNFFHHRVVLALHPYVRPAEKEEAETFFRGLNFLEVKRIRVGGGELIVLEQEQGATTPG